jgi:DNA polymerase-3 subunit epsilon
MSGMDFFEQARSGAIQWARELLKRDPATWVILDTETTGLNAWDEVIQIGVIDGAGHTLMDNVLVKPVCDVSVGAYSVHGISNEMLSTAPAFNDLIPRLEEVVKGKCLVIYNAAYDLRMLNQSARQHVFKIDTVADGVTCAMNKYAEFVGEWNDYRGSFRWQKLPGGDHSALGDCRAVLKLIRMMADSECVR